MFKGNKNVNSKWFSPHLYFLPKLGRYISTTNGSNYGKAKHMLSFSIISALNYSRNYILKKIYLRFLMFFSWFYNQYLPIFIFGSITKKKNKLFLFIERQVGSLDKKKCWKVCYVFSLHFLFNSLSKH